MGTSNDLPPLGKAIVFVGGMLGLAAACAAIFLVPINGILLGALVGMGGPVLGVGIARPIAVLLTKKKG